MQTDHLHDAILLNVTLEWRERGTAELRFDGVPGQRGVLRVTGVRSLAAPMLGPWGWSAYVNVVREVPGAEGERVLEVEMQSGDTIRVGATSWQFEASEDGRA